MKNIALLLASIVIFLVGIIFKLIHLPGAAIFLIIALAVFIIWSAASYIQTKSPVMKKVLIISAIVLLVTLIVAMIRFEYFAEVLIGSVLLGLIIFLLSILSEKKKGDNYNPEN
jgi:O-antigen ligase